MICGWFGQFVDVGAARAWRRRGLAIDGKDILLAGNTFFSCTFDVIHANMVDFIVILKNLYVVASQFRRASLSSQKYAKERGTRAVVAQFSHKAFNFIQVPARTIKYLSQKPTSHLQLGSISNRDS